MNDKFKEGELILITDDLNENFVPRVFICMTNENKFETYTNVNSVDGNIKEMGKTSWRFAKKLKGEIHNDFKYKHTKLLNLPKYVMQTALLRQYEQGNGFDATLDLVKENFDGNFHWADSKEGNDIWEYINENQYYDKFCLFHGITKGELNEDNPEYVQLVKKHYVNADKAFLKQNKLLNKDFY